MGNADKACSTQARAIKHLSASFLFLCPPAGLELSGLERFKRREEGSVAESLHFMCDIFFTSLKTQNFPFPIPSGNSES
jgi:hypothetical protein